MKSLVSFLVGALVGAIVVWFGFAKNVILVNGTTLVEVNRFTGDAKEVFYSYAEAGRLRREEDAKVEKFEAEWEKAHLTEQSVEAGSQSGEKEAVGPELTTEELAQVKFAGELPENSNYMSYRIYNGTQKMLTSAEVRIEGVDKASGLPIGRNLGLEFQLPPATDISSTKSFESGSISAQRTTDLKVTLVKARSAATQ